MSERQTPHLHDNELFTLLDGELPERDASQFRSHMEACWTCRTRLEEMKSTIGEYVRYRDALRPLFPPPASWGDLQPALEQVDRSLSLAPSPRRSFRIRLFGLRRPAYGLAAAALILAFILIRGFEHVPAVSAAELLAKAGAVEQKPSPGWRIQIKTRHWQFIRPALLATKTTSQQTDVQQMFERAHFSWEEPLSARSFAAWRDQLRQKTDAVPALDNFVYKIQTSTPASELRNATLVLRAADLRPLSERLEFITGTVEITAAPDAATPVEIAAAPSPAPERTPAREAVRPVEIVSSFHRELQVFSALHKIGADLGEPLEMSSDASRLLVTGTGLTPARQQQLRASLQDIPGVEIRFEEATPKPRVNSTPADRATSANAPVQQRLQTLLGSRESVEDFTDRALDASDNMMARAHALRSLAKAFPPEVESSLSAGDRDSLRTLRSDHVAALAARLRELRTIVEPVLSPTPVAPPPGAAPISLWQDAAQALFAAAQNLDQRLNRALAGSNRDTQDGDFERIATALARVERAAGANP